MFAVLLVSSGGLAGCTSAAINSHSSVGRFTLQIRLDTTKVDVGTPISGTATLRNGTNKSFSWDNCFGSSVDVGLVGTVPPSTPSLHLLFFEEGIQTHSSMRYPVTVQTTYDGCGFSGVPKCPQMHPAPSSWELHGRRREIRSSNLHRSPTYPKVMLVNATTGRSVGPREAQYWSRHTGAKLFRIPSRQSL